MPENIIDRLKAKEDEMEVLLAEARKKAAAIREGAVRKAMALKGAEDIEEEVAAMRAEAASEVEAESRRLKAEGGAEAERIRAAGAERFEEAVGTAIRLIAEGIDDREDDEGPDNRA